MQKIKRNGVALTGRTTYEELAKSYIEKRVVLCLSVLMLIAIIYLGREKKNGNNKYYFF